MMRLLRLSAAIFVALAVSAPSALAKPPLDAFGDVPAIRAMQLSPDGKKVAFLRHQGADDFLMLYDLTTKVSKPLTRVSEIKARYVQFLSNDRIVIIASKSTRTSGFRGRYDFSAAFSFDLNTGKFVQLLNGTRDLFPAQTGLGRIIGVDADGKNAMMPAFTGEQYSEPSLSLLRVPLDTGRGSIIDGGRGGPSTIDWFVDSTGRAVVREDFVESSKEHAVRARQADGSWKVVYSHTAPLQEVSVVGVSPDAKSMFAVANTDSEFMTLSTMSTTDGAIKGPVFQRDDASVEDIVSDNNRIVHGVRYSGMFPSYEMFDKEIGADINIVMNALKGSAVYLTSWSDDWSTLLFVASGGNAAERYLIYDRPNKRLSLIASSRPEITAADVGEVVTIEYKARDGLKIPSLITWPAGVAPADRKKLPTIIMPHGGPEAYDSVGFDWLAQFLANEGYAVLQPNFRGSSGFGTVFASAGYGEWGRKMQDDITDGADALVAMGWADPERMCIVGWSYGGYAALQGGVSTPDKYKCVAAIAGVSDLREMLSYERSAHGADSQSVAYWKMLIGDAEKDREAIDAVSPALHVDKYKAPVLLVHGASDKVVPIRQSEIMIEALRRANKPVEYLRIEGDDHNLVDSGSRNQMLTRLSEFLKRHIGK